MVAKNISVEKFRADGKREVYCVIYADTVPATLPSTGADIENLTENDVFAVGSILYVVATSASTKMYIAGTDGIFVAQ